VRQEAKNSAAPPLSSYSFAVWLLLLPSLIVAPALLISANTWATTIEGYSLRLSDDVSQLEFRMRGTAPRWHLHSNGQELWLDLERSRVDPSVGPVSTRFASPLTRVSIHDFGHGRVQLTLRVRGQVDYVVAQLPHVLVVRIAPSGRKLDLAEPLLADIEQNRLSSLSRSASTIAIQPLRDYRDPAIAESGHRISLAAVNTANQSAVTESRVVGPGRAASASLAPAFTNEAYSSQTAAPTVRPVTQRVRPVPWVKQDTEPIAAIDPGHGGFDPGTESADGIAEKTVALAISRRLATALESRGIGAELTRNDDSFLSLGQRTELASHSHADLFISIHLNSSPDWSTSGIETYYLNNTTDRATLRLARIENGADYGALNQSNLNYILANLQQDYKAHESSSLARMIEAEVATSIDATLGTRVRPLGAKMGPFYVLVGTEMPSVLIECGFLSNPREAQLLMQPSYQQALADGIAAAVMHYFNAGAAVGNL
jgi:N-acetylmuramoyl-L-alanine amidase